MHRNKNIYNLFNKPYKNIAKTYIKATVALDEAIGSF